MVGGPQDFSVSPSPLATNWVFELSWGWAKVGGLGTKGLGPGLHNIGTIKFCCPVSNQLWENSTLTFDLHYEKALFVSYDIYWLWNPQGANKEDNPAVRLGWRRVPGPPLTLVLRSPLQSPHLSNQSVSTWDASFSNKKNVTVVRFSQALA